MSISKCPHSLCPSFNKPSHVVKDGFYTRSSDKEVIQRFKCKCCQKRFSSATLLLTYRQKKRGKNSLLFSLLASGISMRRASFITKLHRMTIKHRLIFFSQRSLEYQSRLLQNLQVSSFQFDDLITTHHTKLKPLTITLAVETKTRVILGAVVKSIPAFGHLARISREKYGKRKNEHQQGVRELFSKIQNAVRPDALIESDEHKNYPPIVKEYFPKSEHKRYLGGRSCIVGQGELKKLNYDPLFSLNHTCAMLRANINRLIRRTWCTTKNPNMLEHHINLYIHFHNSKLIQI